MHLASLRTPVFVLTIRASQEIQDWRPTLSVWPTVPERNLPQPIIEPGFHEEMSTIAHQLRTYPQQVGAAQTTYRPTSTGTPPVSEDAAFQRELTKERVINNDLQRKIFDEERANEHLKRQLTALRGDLENRLQEDHATLESLQGQLKMAHAIKAELKPQLKNKAEKVTVLKERVFLTEAIHQADLSCLQKQLEELGEQEALRRKVRLQSQAVQTPPSPLPEEGERRQRKKKCE